MDQEFSLAHLSLHGASPIDMISIAAQTGYDYVGFRLTPVTQCEEVFPFLSDAAKLRLVKRALQDQNMRVLDIELVRLEVDKQARDFERLLEVGAELGARHVLCQTPDLDLYRVVQKFGDFCQLANKYDLTADLEFPSWTENGNFAQTAWILEQINQPNAGMLIDTLHFSRSISKIEALKSAPQSWFSFVQVCDARSANIGPVEDMIHIARAERLAPGEGVIPVAAIVSALPCVPYALEIPNDQMRAQMGDKAYAARILQKSKQYLLDNLSSEDIKKQKRRLND